MAEAFAGGYAEEPLFHNAQELKHQFHQAIEDVSGPGGFAYSNENATFPDPDLELHGHGPITLPLSAADADKIIKQAHKSPFGKGTQTLVDDTVRKSWELNPNQFSIRNDAWKPAVDNLLPQVESHMAVSCGAVNIRAELYKLLLYEEGAFFKPHQDTEKIPGMFGTLMIALPSCHRGGELVLRHQSEHMKHNTETNSQSGYSWASWYSDVFHQVHPVTEGYRLVLTYNLAMSSASPTSVLAPSAVASHQRTMQALLKEWNTMLIDSNRPIKANGFPSFLAYPLEHQYTEGNLCLDRLVGDDRAKANCLNHVTRSTGASIFLCTIEVKVVRDDDDGYDDYQDCFEEIDCDEDDCEHDNSDCESYREPSRNNVRDGRDYDEIERVKEMRVVALDGTKVLDDVHFDEDEILGVYRYFSEECADDEDHSGYTGNEGCTATFFYRDTAIVIVPEAKTYEFVFDGDHKWRNACKLLHELREEYTSGQQTVERLDHLCNLLLQAPTAASSTYYRYKPDQIQALEDSKRDCIRDIARIALESGMLGVYDAALRKLTCDSELPMDCFYQLGRCLASVDLHSMKTRISNAIETRRGIARRYEAIEHIKSGFSSASDTCTDSLRNACSQWLDNELIAVATADTESFRKEDGEVLAKIWRTARAETERRTSVETSLFAAPTTIQVGFCLDMAGECESSGISEAMQRDIMATSLTQLWRRYSLNTAEVIKSLGAPDSLTLIKSIVNDTDLVDLLRLSDRYGINLSENNQQDEDVPDPVVAILLRQSRTATAEDLKYTLLPLVGHLVAKALPQLLDPDNGNPGESAKSLAQSIICTYVTRCIGFKPLAPCDRRSPGQCSCKDCRLVNVFLQDPTKVDALYTMGPTRRQHLRMTFGQERDLELKIETNSRSMPGTVHMTKTRKAFNDKLLAWNGRVAEFWPLVAKMERKDSAWFHQLVGHRIANALQQKDMSSLLQCAEGGMLPLAEISGNASNKRAREDDGVATSSKRIVSGRSHPVEVIDLTGE